jgi:hypothetical protein
MSHKAGHIIVKMSAAEESDPIKSAEVQIDVTGKTPEQVAAITRRVVKKIETMSVDED